MTLRAGQREDIHASWVSLFVVASAKSGLTRLSIHIGWKWPGSRHAVFIAYGGTRRKQDPVTVRSETRTGFSHFYTSNSLPPRHLLFHQQHPSQVTFFHAADQAAELRKQACILAIAAPLGSGSVL